MRITDLYEDNEFLTDKDQIVKWMEKSVEYFHINKLSIEEDGLIYEGNISLYTFFATEIKVQFKEVIGYFRCVSNGMASLKGFPKLIGDYFSCNSTNITSLKYCPQSINGYFGCKNTKITDPKEYRYALYSEIGGKFESNNGQINEIINEYKGATNRKHWPKAINLLSKVQL